MRKTARGGGGGARQTPLHNRSRDVSHRGRQSGTINARLVGISSVRKNIPWGAGKECIVGGEEMGERGGGRGGGRHDKVGRRQRTRTRQPVMATTMTAGDCKKQRLADDGGGRDRRAGAGGCDERRRVRLPTEARGRGGGGALSPSHRQSQQAGRPGEPSDLSGRRGCPASTQSDISPGGGLLRMSTTTARDRALLEIRGQIGAQGCPVSADPTSGA
jgi:hypothetical protein